MNINKYKDKIEHVCACGITAMLASLLTYKAGGNKWACFVSGFCAGMSIGVGKEYGDKCAKGNKWDWNDIVADTIGSLVGSCVSFLVA